MPRNYPKAGKSFLLKNESTRDKVKFTDVTDEIAKELSTIGMVTDAVFMDINHDEQIDLVLTGEWMPVTIFINQNGHFVDSTDSWGIRNRDIVLAISLYYKNKRIIQIQNIYSMV